MNPFCPNLSNKQVKKEFEELVDAVGENAAYYFWDANNGYSLDKAPNGADSKLFQSLLDNYKGDRKQAIVAKAKTYTDSFRNWFGDWLSEDKTNVSKVVDENGEPLVVYHGTTENFDEFDFSKVGNVTGLGYFTDPVTGEQIHSDSASAFFFTNDYYSAKSYKNLASYSLAKERLIFYNNLAAVFLGKNFLFRSLNKEDSQRLRDFIDNILSPILGIDVRKEANAIISNESNMSEKTRKYYGDKFRNAAKEIDGVIKPNYVSNQAINLKTNIDDFNFIKNNKETILNNILIDRFKEYVITITSGFGNREKGEVYTILEYKDGEYLAVGIPGTVGLVPVTKNNFELLLNEMYKGIRQNKEDLDKEESGKVYGRGKIMPVFLNIKNPLTHDYNYSPFPDKYLIPSKEEDKTSFYVPGIEDKLFKKTIYPTTYIAARQVRKAKKENNDGVIYENIVDPYIMTSYGIFNSNQVKSIDNEGPFSQQDNNIYHNLNDNKYQGVEIDEIARTNDKTFKRINKIVLKLKRKFPGLQVRIITESEIPSGVRKEANAFVKDGVVYIIQGRTTSEMTVEEFLHPFISTLVNDNNNLFDQLLEEARKDFPKLVLEIEHNYSDKNGFTESDRLQELVTQALARYLHKEINKSTIRKWLENFANWITGALQGKWNYVHGVKSYDLSKLKNMSLKDLSKFIDKQDAAFQLQYENDTKYSINTNRTQQHKDQVREEIIKHFDRLYRSYRSDINKSKSRLKLQDEIFETLNELKQQYTTDSINLALAFAKNHLGRINPNTGIVDKKDCILYYLQEQQSLDFKDVTPDILIDMYKNGIGFYKLLAASFPISNDPLYTMAMRNDIMEFNMRLLDCEKLWREALTVVSDRSVDNAIDSMVNTTEENKNRMKDVCKDWLHKNAMYGDINTLERYFFNYAYSTNDIIKLAKAIINSAETKAHRKYLDEIEEIKKEVKKQNTILRRLIPGNWQRLLMEYDNEGKPTGNFVTRLNKGQHSKDLEKFMIDLNERFEKTYGYTYIEDDYGTVVNSVTGEPAENEQWLFNGSNWEQPLYYNYLSEIETWHYQHSEKRYKLDYYLERMSVPYRSNPNATDGSPDGHGLSPAALIRYNHIQSYINYYLEKCTDRVTGIAYVEDLSKEDLLKLDEWKAKLDDLSNPYDAYGNAKSEEDTNIALEIRTWEQFCNEKMYNQSDLDAFEEEVQRIKDECAKSGDYTKFNNFYKYNSTYGTNPDYIQQVLGQFENSIDVEPAIIKLAKLVKSALLNLVKTGNSYSRNIRKFENNIEFFIRCSETDQIIADNQTPKSKEFSDAIKSNFTFKELLYTDDRGFFVDATNPNIKYAPDQTAGKQLLTYREYLAKITYDTYKQTGMIPGLDPVQYKSLYDQLSQSSDVDLMWIIGKFFVYEVANVTGETQFRPSSIFTIMYPSTSTFFNKRTNRKEQTMIYVPKGRFSKRENKGWYGDYVNEKFDTTNSSGIQPSEDMYDNSKAYYKMRKRGLGRLYDLLTKAVSESIQRTASGISIYDYRLPQMESGTYAALSRIPQNGILSTALYFWERSTTIGNTDDEYRVASDYAKNPDGSTLTSVPRRFVERVDRPEFISSEVVFGTLSMIEMANMYEQKNMVLKELQMYELNMDERFRDSDYKETGKRSADMYSSMMHQHMYGESILTNKSSNKPLPKSRVLALKFMSSFIARQSLHLLQSNLKSALNGFFDSFLTTVRESLTHKYATPTQRFNTFLLALTDLPKIIINLENPVANCKAVAMMQLNKLVKDNRETFKGLHHTRASRLLVDAPMGIFSMFDYFNTLWIMRSYYSNVKFYGGDDIEKGFYTRSQFINEFINAGYNKKQALAQYNASDVSLWDAYEFKNHTAKVKDLYKDYVTNKVSNQVRAKITQRAALANGMNPDNDVAEFKRNMWGRIVGALRSFLFQNLQHYMAGGHSFVPIYDAETTSTEVHGGKTKVVKKYKKHTYTDEERTLLGGYNFDTGEMQDESMTAFFRSFKTLYRVASNSLNDLLGRAKKHPDAKVSVVERRAWVDIISLLCLSGFFFVACIPIHKWALTAIETKGMKLNPVEWWNTQLYKPLVDNLVFLQYQSQLTKIDPTTLLELVRDITVYKNSFDEQMLIFQFAADALGLTDHTLTEKIDRGSYKGEERWVRLTFKTSGILDNIHTFTSYSGLVLNRNFYYNKFSDLHKLLGFDLNKIKNTTSTGWSGFDDSGFDSYDADYDYDYNVDYDVDYDY